MRHTSLQPADSPSLPRLLDEYNLKLEEVVSVLGSIMRQTDSYSSAIKAVIVALRLHRVLDEEPYQEGVRIVINLPATAPETARAESALVLPMRPRRPALAPPAEKQVKRVHTLTDTKPDTLSGEREVVGISHPTAKRPR